MNRQSCRIGPKTLVLAGLAALAGCGAPKPAPTPARTEAPPAPWSWTFASDVERIGRLYVAGRDVWGVSQLGLIHWDRASGVVRVEGAGAPGADVTSLAQAQDGLVYAGLPSGIAWRKLDGTWSQAASGPLAGGVVALVPRAEGGVWVALSTGLAHFSDGHLVVVSDRHRIRGFSAGPDGVAWAATDGLGVLRLGSTLEEYTSGQGVCGNQIRAVFAGPGGQVGVTCLEPGNRARFSLGKDGVFTTFEIPELASHIERVEPLADRILVHALGADYRLDVEVARPPARGTKAAPAESARALLARAVADVGLAEPPPPVVPASEPPPAPPAPLALVAAPPTAPGAPATAPGVAEELARLAAGGQTAPSVNVTLPAPVSMPAPIAPVPLPELSVASLPVRRAARPAGAPTPLEYRLRPYPAGVPVDTAVTATATTSDGTSWFALANRGVLAVRDSDRRRYSSQSLVPIGEGADLAADRRGRVIMTDGLHRLLRCQEGTWSPWTVDADRAVLILGAAFDEFAQVWALGYRAGEKQLRIYKSADSGAFSAIGKVDLPALDGPPRTGRLVVGRDGTLMFPLFWLDKGAKTRGAGLGRVGPAMDRLEVWAAATDEEPTPDTVQLPDAWVGALALAPAGGTLFLGTNAGLARVAGTSVRTFDENAFLASEVILAVDLDTEGRLWAGTMEGLGYLKNDEWHGTRDPALRERVLAVRADAGRLWVGTDAGLFLGEGERFARVGQANGGFEVPGPVRDIELDGEGGLWVLTGQGILHAKTTAKR